MKRAAAIEQLAIRHLSELSPEDRAEQLDIMTLEDWSETVGWNTLPEAIQEEFAEGELQISPIDARYDPVLLIWLKGQFRAVTNAYLEGELQVTIDEGIREFREACPCCGRKTIGARGNYAICRVCWWEDDGQDNAQADEVLGGPNDNISLTMGRYNFLKYEIYDPERADLVKLKEPKEKYELGREFRLREDNAVVEIGTDWVGKRN